jgi:hypothetical protein
MLLHAAQLAKFGLDNNAFGMRRVHHALVAAMFSSNGKLLASIMTEE